MFFEQFRYKTKMLFKQIFIQNNNQNTKYTLINLLSWITVKRVYVVPQRSWGDRSDTDHSKCLLLGGRRLNLLTIIPKPKGSGGARAATAQIGPANERNKTK